jgi:hypothetical protein
MDPWMGLSRVTTGGVLAETTVRIPGVDRRS